MFLVKGGEDLHLKAGADAIAAGPIVSPGSTVDIDSESRPVGPAWDIGAESQEQAGVRRFVAEEFSKRPTRRAMGAQVR